MASSAEADFCALVMDVAQRMGLKVHWCSDSRKCYGNRGFPDLVIMGPRGIKFAELKMPGGETTAEQDDWAYRLSQLGRSPCRVCGQAEQTDTLYELWFPDHLENGTIERVLEQLR